MASTGLSSPYAVPVPHRVTVLPGDGVGPELVAATRRVLAASGAILEWEEQTVGLAAVAAGRPALPDDVVASVRRNGVALKGPLATPPGAGFRSLNVALRRRLGLYAQVRPSRSRAGVPSRYAGVDLAILRETTEDLYAGFELDAQHKDTVELLAWLAGRGLRLPAGAGVSLRPTTAAASARVASFALDHAASRGHDRLTVVHKATVMRSTDGLFLATVREVAASHPAGLTIDDLSVDVAAAELVRRPDSFGLLLMPNLYGDVLSDLAAALVGGIGLASGANYGDGVAMFEAGHGTAPRHAGRDRANPLGVLLSGVLLLHHLGEHLAAQRVDRAVDRVLADGTYVTADLRAADDDRPPVGTQAMADAVVAAMDEPPADRTAG